MKQKIYTLNSTFTRAHRCLLLSISFSIFGTFASAQQSSPYNSRNVNHNAAVGRLTSEATPAAVRTLSVNPAVSPNQNQLPTGAPAQTSQGIAGNIFLNNGASKIASFTGISVNGEYQLTWETVIENDVKQYTIEYSLNNQDFAVAAVVSAANRSTYTFNHIIDAAPTMYYRLRVTDRNGGNVYSNPIFINSTLGRAADQVTPSIIRDGFLISPWLMLIKMFSCITMQVLKYSGNILVAVPATE